MSFSTLNLYPIQKNYSLDIFDLNYKTFVNQIFTTYEPQFYNQAILYLEWRNVMAQQIKALEDNVNWSLVLSPKDKDFLR